MGNNEAFSSFEKMVLIAYNKDVLDKQLLSEMMEQYRGMDIDHGGMAGTLSKDGLDCEEITLKVFGKKLPDRPKLPKDYRKWNEEQHQANDGYQEAKSDGFNKISMGRFGWC